uniref:Solute carrier family 23 member 3 n=1 Tax=Ornithorhynchus anatinus TaxID=9258 RepID=A0A6I8NFH0_ORNAN
MSGAAARDPPPPSWGAPDGPQPSWGLCGLLAAQHVLVLTSLLCVSHLPLLGEDPGGPGPRPPAQLLASSFFSCGLTTLLQVWGGSRLPLVQAPTLEFLIPALVLTTVHTPPNAPQLLNNGSRAAASSRESLQEVSGAVLVSGLLRVTAGLLSGPGGLLARCGPLVLAPTLVVAGLTAHREAALLCAHHWGLALGLILLMVVCSQHLASCSVPACPRSPARRPPLPVFRLFSVVIPVACVWSLWALLGPARPPPSHLSGPAPAPWLWFPHPGEGGRPALTPRAVAAGTAMALASSASSLGCYTLAGQVLSLPAPPPHACSRGLVAEGLGSLLAGGLGGLGGSAASFANVGAIGLTQAGRRREVQLAGLLCVALGLSPRLAQALVTLPPPLHGAVLSVSQAPVLSGGLARFRAADLHSGRNVFLVGLAVFMALLLPRALTRRPPQRPPASLLLLLRTGTAPVTGHPPGAHRAPGTPRGRPPGGAVEQMGAVERKGARGRPPGGAVGRARWERTGTGGRSLGGAVELCGTGGRRGAATGGRCGADGRLGWAGWSGRALGGRCGAGTAGR